MNITEKISPFSAVPSGEGNPRAGNDLILLKCHTYFCWTKTKCCCRGANITTPVPPFPPEECTGKMMPSAGWCLKIRHGKRKRQRFLYKTSPPVQYMHGKLLWWSLLSVLCRSACVCVPQAHVSWLFSGDKKSRKSGFCLIPSVIGEFGHRVVHQPCLTEGCGHASGSSVIPLPAPLHQEQQSGELRTAGHEPKA